MLQHIPLALQSFQLDSPDPMGRPLPSAQQTRRAEGLASSALPARFGRPRVLSYMKKTKAATPTQGSKGKAILLRLLFCVLTKLRGLRSTQLSKGSQCSKSGKLHKSDVVWHVVATRKRYHSKSRLLHGPTQTQQLVQNKHASLHRVARRPIAMRRRRMVALH